MKINHFQKLQNLSLPYSYFEVALTFFTGLYISSRLAFHLSIKELVNDNLLLFFTKIMQALHIALC